MIDFFKQLELIEDPRKGNRKVYPLSFLLYCILMATIAGARSWYQMEDYCSDHIDELNEEYRKITGLDKNFNSPSHDTLNKCLAIIDKEQFQTIKNYWIELFFPNIDREQFIIDGKTLRGVKKLSFDNESHVVSAYNPSTKITFAEEYVNSKKGELNGIKDLISRLEITNAIVTIDSLGCQKDIAKAITEKDGKYLLQLKSNQKTTLLKVKDLFEKHQDLVVEFEEEPESGHGRIDKRIYRYITDSELIKEISGWENLNTIVACYKDSYTKSSKKTEKSIRYYLSSEEPAKAIVAIRRHWAIESNLHYCLDVFFDQDASTKRAGNAAQNMDVIQKIALSLVYCLKQKLNKSIPRVIFLLSNKSPSRILKLLF